MKLFKLLPLILSAFALSACAEIPPVKEPVPAEQQKTLAAPEDGWTAKELLSVTYFEGIELCSPMTIEDFGSRYTIANSFLADDGIRYHNLAENNFSFETYAGLIFEHNDENVSYNDEIKSMNEFHGHTSVNGIRKTSSAADVERLLGKPDRTEYTNDHITDCYYDDRETGKELLCVSIDNSDSTVSGFFILLQ